MGDPLCDMKLDIGREGTSAVPAVLALQQRTFDDKLKLIEHVRTQARRYNQLWNVCNEAFEVMRYHGLDEEVLKLEAKMYAPTIDDVTTGTEGTKRVGG